MRNRLRSGQNSMPSRQPIPARPFGDYSPTTVIAMTEGAQSTYCRPSPAPARGPQPAIEVEQLVREFRKGPRAVDGIDLAVSPGEIYGFLGPNGAGKSTTVLMLTTLLPPTSGRATVGGFDIVRQGAQVRATIGAALQEAALDAILTGREHLLLQATLQGLPGAERRRRADELLERVGLTEAAGRRVGGYSGG